MLSLKTVSYIYFFQLENRISHLKIVVPTLNYSMFESYAHKINTFWNIQTIFFNLLIELLHTLQKPAVPLNWPIELQCCFLIIRRSLKLFHKNIRCAVCKKILSPDSSALNTTFRHCIITRILVDIVGIVDIVR